MVSDSRHGEFGISGRRYCTLSDEAGARIVQLHFFSADSPEVQRHIAFRDYLRAHPDVAKAYENEKRRAAYALVALVFVLGLLGGVFAARSGG